MNKKIPTEEQEQKALVGWLTRKKIFFFAPTNENNSYKQDRKYAMIAEQKAKAMGKRKGVSDLAIFLPNFILFLELKRRPKKLKSGKSSVSHTKISKEQILFISKVSEFRYALGVVAYGFEDARMIIEKVYNLSANEAKKLINE